MSTSPDRTKRPVSRRGFLAAATAAAAAPAILPASVFGANAPSNRITIGVLGCGNQTRVDVPSMLKQPDSQIIAVCDVNRGSYGYSRPEHFLGREPVQAQVNKYYAEKTGKADYQGCDAYADLRELLARDDIDAVMIILPDHWHALATKMACEAG